MAGIPALDPSTEIIDDLEGQDPDEQIFRLWYADRASKLGLNPNPDDPQHHYDYRAAFNAGVEPGLDGHWDSSFKAPDHPNRFVDINGQRIDTITGQVAPPALVPSLTRPLPVDVNARPLPNGVEPPVPAPPPGPVPALAPDVQIVDDISNRPPYQEAQHPILGGLLSAAAMVPPIVAGMTGYGLPAVGAIGAASNVAVEELRNRLLEHRTPNMGERLVSAGVGAFPGLGHARTLVGNIGLGGAEGALLGAGQTYGGALARGEKLPTLDQAGDEIATAALGGSAVRSLFHGVNKAAEASANRILLPLKEAAFRGEQWAEAEAAYRRWADDLQPGKPPSEPPDVPPTGPEAPPSPPDVPPVAPKQGASSRFWTFDTQDGTLSPHTEGQPLAPHQVLIEHQPDTGDVLPADAGTGINLDEYEHWFDQATKKWVEQHGKPGEPPTPAEGPVVGPKGPTSPAAPGDQGVSPEAINRVSNEKAGDVAYWKYDKRSGKFTPIPLGVDMADTFPGPHEVIVRRGYDDEFTAWQVGEQVDQAATRRALDAARGEFGRKPPVGETIEPAPDTTEPVARGSNVDAWGFDHETGTLRPIFTGESFKPRAGESIWKVNPHGKSIPLDAGADVTASADELRPRFESALDKYWGIEREPGAPDTEPVQTPEAPDTPSIQSDIPEERRVTAYGASGRTYELGYRVVSLDDLVVNHPDTQPRQRTRSASPAQIAKIAAELDADKYFAGSDTLDRGASIIGNDLKVESGNGRVLSMRRAREMHPEVYQQFLERMKTRARRHGLTDADFEGIKDPIVVRERLTPVKDRKAFAREANRGASMKLSPVEQALDDAELLPDDAVSRIEVGEKQTIEQALLSGRNSDVVRAFIEALPDEDLNAIVDAAAGTLNKDGVQRIKNALLARVFNDEEGQRLITSLIEGGASNAKTVEAALYNTAAKLAKMRELIASGARGAEYDIVGNVTRVLNKLKQIRADSDMTVDKYLRQRTLDGKRELSPFEEELLEQFDKARSVNKMADHFRRYAAEVDDLGQANQTGLPGVKAEAPSPRDLWKRAGATEQGGLEGVLAMRRAPSDEAPTTRLPLAREGGTSAQRTVATEINPAPEPTEESLSKLASPGRDTTAEVNPPGSPRGNPDWVSRNTTPDQAPIRRQAMVDWIAEKLQVPIRYRHMGVTRDVLGFFKIRPKVIRTQQYGDIPVIYHEIGHWLKREPAGAEFVQGKLRPFAAELQPLASWYPPKLQLEEGFAEFLRHYVESPDELQKLAPTFYAHFDKVVPGDLRELFLQARRDWLRFRQQGPQARILSQISFNKATPIRSGRRVLDQLYTDMIDNFHPIGVAVKELLAKAGLTAKTFALDYSLDPKKWADLSRGSMGRVRTFLEHKTFAMSDPLGKKGEGLFPILEELRDKTDPDWLDKFRVYALSRRVMEREASGKATGISKEDARHAYDSLHTPARDKVFQDLQEYQKHLLEYLVEAGVLSQKSFARILAKSEDFVPMYRVLDWSGGSWGGGSGRFVDTFDPVKYFKGSSRPIVDPIESIVRNTIAYQSLAHRNMVGKSMLRLAETLPGGGEIMERVPWDKKPIFADQRHMAAIFDDLVKNKVIERDLADTLLEELPPELLAGFEQTRNIPKTGPYVRVMTDGKPVLVHVKDEFLWRGLQQLDNEQASTIVRWLAKPAALLRGGATLDPEFAIRNFLRDQSQAFIQSKAGYVPFVDAVTGAKATTKRTEDFWNFLAAGGGQSHLVSADRDELAKTLQHFDEYQSRGTKLKNVIRSPYEGLQKLSMLSENMTRVGESMRIQKSLANANISPLEKAMRMGHGSREVSVDFGRHGAKTMAMRLSVAFWNARVQGLDRIVRRAIENPAAFIAKTAVSITLPSVALWAANHDDARYQEIPQWQKDLFWIIIPSGHISRAAWDKMTPAEQATQMGTVWRWPKPFEMGVLFGSLPERMLDRMYHHDPQTMSKWAGNMLSSLSLSPVDQLPTGIKPLFENYSNYSTFRQRDIVPPGLERVDPREQTTPYTSELARLFGNLFNYSPAKVDNLLRGYGGGLGATATQTIDEAVKLGRQVTGSAKTTPTKQLADWPIARALTVRQPTSQAESIDRFWAANHEAEQTKATYNKIMRGDVPRGRAYFKEHATVLQKMPYLSAQAKIMQDLSAKIEALRNRPGKLSPDELRRQMSVLQLRQTQVAHRALKVLKLTGD